jgi:hypothetical protein
MQRKEHIKPFIMQIKLRSKTNERGMLLCKVRFLTFRISCLLLISSLSLLPVVSASKHTKILMAALHWGGAH